MGDTLAMVVDMLDQDLVEDRMVADHTVVDEVVADMEELDMLVENAKEAPGDAPASSPEGVYGPRASSSPHSESIGGFNSPT